MLVKYTDVQICREELTILDHVNFELYSGEFVYFIGRVGSGKSSLLKTMYEIQNDETPVIPLYNEEKILGATKNLEGFELSRIGAHQFENAVVYVD